MNGWLWEHSAVPFVVITLALGGGGAWMTGRSVARSWTHPAILFFYCALLSFAVRFLHFALGDGALLSPWFLAVDYALMLMIAALGFRATRTSQMTTQYFWLYQRTSPLTWRDRVGSGQGEGGRAGAAS